jgi:hypothetical protein
MEAVTWTKKEFPESLSHNEGRRTAALINTFEKMEPHVVGASPHTSWVSRAEAFTLRAVLQQSALPAVVFLPMSSDFTIKR